MRFSILKSKSWNAVSLLFQGEEICPTCYQWQVDVRRRYMYASAGVEKLIQFTLHAGGPAISEKWSLKRDQRTSQPKLSYERATGIVNPANSVRGSMQWNFTARCQRNICAPEHELWKCCCRFCYDSHRCCFNTHSTEQCQLLGMLSVMKAAGHCYSASQVSARILKKRSAKQKTL